MQKTDEIVNTQKSECAWRARKDADQRIAHALKEASDYFNDSEYQQKVAEVSAIVQKFFTVSKGFYVNPRLNRGNPFTTIKVDNPKFPNHLSRSVREKTFYKPLEAMGVEIRFSKGTNSYLFKVQ